MITKKQMTIHYTIITSCVLISSYYKSFDFRVIQTLWKSNTKESSFVIFTIHLQIKKAITIKTQRRARRGTKYHAAPTKTGRSTLNAADAVP